MPSAMKAEKWVITLYEPYHLPPESEEGGDTGEGGHLRFMSRIVCVKNLRTNCSYPLVRGYYQRLLTCPLLFPSARITNYLTQDSQEVICL